MTSALNNRFLVGEEQIENQTKLKDTLASLNIWTVNNNVPQYELINEIILLYCYICT